jgi:hypothetical protein
MFNIQCSNSKCREYQNPVLEIVKDSKGNVDFSKSLVICSICEKSMPSVTEFTKRSMYGLGQIKRKNDVKKAFAIVCKECDKKDQPLLINNEVTCPHCNTIHQDLAKPYLQTIRQFLSSK